MKPERYDVLIIGAGQAAIPLAYKLAAQGYRVALAERQHLGGSCVNFGCTPSKAVLASARVASLARKAGEFGLDIPEVKVDFPAVIERAKQISKNSRKGLSEGFKDSENPILLEGHASFKRRNENGEFEISIDSNEVQAKYVVVDTGATSRIPKIKGLSEVDYITSENWLDKTTLPEHLVVMGGGYVGLEMGQFYRRMGSDVTILDHGEQIAGDEDEDVAARLQSLLEKERIQFHLNCEVKKVEIDNGDYRLNVKNINGDFNEIASDIFLAVGRKPNTKNLGLENVGVAVDNEGFIETDNNLQTSVPNIWAAGDVRDTSMFTHSSYHDYKVILSKINDRNEIAPAHDVPYAIFTDPELGRVGITEREARQGNFNFKVARYEMKNNGRANESGDTSGFVKVIVDEESEQILGAAVLSPQGGELVHIFIDIMKAKAPYTVIRDAIHIHPTRAEALQSAVASL